MPKVALLTERRYVDSQRGGAYVGNIFEEDRLVVEGLAGRGVETTRVDWADPSVAWESFDAAVFRTTWDYFERFGEFTRWLDAVSSQVRLINSPQLVRWNWDKHYLLELQDAGISIVPTDVFERGGALDLAEHLRARGWDDAVVKPAVSGAARHTYRVSIDDASEHQAQLDALLQEEAMLVQPFMPQIVANGETTLAFVEGKVTHAVVKRAKPGDFRVQDDFGGTVSEHEPSADEIAFTERALAACPEPPMYGRADLCRDEQGQLRLMELELIEPEMWFRFHPPAADAFAEALVRRLRESNR